MSTSTARRRARTRIVLRPGFTETLAKAGFSVTAFAAAAGVGRTMIYALINPAQHAERKGGMTRVTAWKIAAAYAARQQISAQEAYDTLLTEELC